MTPKLHVCIVPSKLTSETESKNAGCFSIAQNNKAEFCILEQGQAEHSVACYWAGHLEFGLFLWRIASESALCVP